MSTFFRNFPLVRYKYGNEVDTALTQNISTYINILDELRDDIAFYEKVTVGEFERPDTLSFKLYGHSNFHWTFYFLNSHVRESGWPLSVQELYTRVQKDYPNRVVTTSSPMHDILLPGAPVRGSQSGTLGTVVKRNLDLGQLIIRANGNFNDQTSASESAFEEIIDLTSGASAEAKVTSVSEVVQYNAVHHYEDSTGEWQHFTPNTTSGGVNLTAGAGWLPVTYWERYEKRNNELRELKVLTPDVAAQVQSEFNRLLREG
jgi:hypothetical protein